MVFIVMMLALFITSTESIPKKACDKVKIRDQWYDRRTILSNVGRPYNLNVHRTTNTLFFSYSLPDTYTDVDFQLFCVNLDTKDHQIIAGIRGGCAVTIDQVNDIVYLGGSDGIYKYNMLTKLADFYKEMGKNIWSLYYKENLFYISYPDQKLFIEIDGKFMKVREFEGFEVDVFHVSYSNELYFFANKTGLYKFDSATFTIDPLNELVSVRQITEDNDGVMYICTNFGIYSYNADEDKVFKVVDIRNVYGITFDKDNQFVLSGEKNIVVLVRTETGCEYKDSEW